MKRIPILSLISISCMGLAALGEKRPNILWFVVDDMSANFSCYGEKAIETPNLDKLAEDGIRDVERSRGLGDVYKRQLYGVGSLGGKTTEHSLVCR